MILVKECRVRFFNDQLQNRAYFSLSRVINIFYEYLNIYFIKTQTIYFVFDIINISKNVVLVCM